jgi:phosphomannomutase
MSEAVDLPELADLDGRIRAWIDDEVDAGDASELQAMLANANRGDEVALAGLADRFAGTLTFGTAGLRGPWCAGRRVGWPGT